MPDVFLSYNREDQAVARRFAEGFERAGFSVWWDVTLRSGEAYDKVTEDALKSAKAVVVLWSKKSVDSRWVRAEATLADRNKTLVPVMIEPCERPIMFELTQTADLTRWKGDANDPAWMNFVSDVRRFVAGHAAAGSAPLAATMPPRPARKAQYTVAAVAVVALLGGGYWFTRGPAPVTAAIGTAASATGTSPATSATPAPADAAAIAHESIAVLPFANLSPDTNDAYVASGLHDEILNQLGKLSKLKVISRQSVLRFADSKLSAPEIAKELQVAHIMEGSVRFANDRIRVNAQLIDAKTDKQLWSDTFDIKFADIFDAEAQIAMNVANAMRVSFSEDERIRIEKIPTKSPQAYALYLQSSSLRADIAFGSQSAIAKTHQLLDSAIAIDPDFAVAVMRKADLYGFGQQMWEAANQTAAKAVAIDPALSPTRDSIKLRTLIDTWQLAEAKRISESLLQKQPNDPIALAASWRLGLFTYDMPKVFDFSLRRFELEKTADAYDTMGRGFAYLGNHEEAVKHLQQAVQLNRNNVTTQLELAYNLAAAGHKEEATGWINAVKTTVLGADEEKDAGPNLYSAMIYANALAGRDAEAKRLLGKFKQNSEAGSDLPTRARAYIAGGDLEQGLALLKQLVTNKTMNHANSIFPVVYLKLNTYHLPALERPEFVEVRKQL